MEATSSDGSAVTDEVNQSEENCALAYHDSMGVLRFVNIASPVWGYTLLQKIGAVEGVLHPVLQLYVRGRRLHEQRRYTYMGLMEYGPLRVHVDEVLRQRLIERTPLRRPDEGDYDALVLAIEDGEVAPPADVMLTPDLPPVPVPHALFTPAPANTS